MGIKHSNLHFAFCCLLATASLSACSGGGSSSGAPAISGPGASAPAPSDPSADGRDEPLPPVFTAEARAAAERSLQQVRASLSSQANPSPSQAERTFAQRQTVLATEISQARANLLAWQNIRTAFLRDDDNAERLALALSHVYGHAATTIESALSDWNDRLRTLQAEHAVISQALAAVRRATPSADQLRQLRQDVIDALAVVNVAADVADGRAPAVAQTGQRFALVHATARKTGAVLAFDTAGGDIDGETPDTLFFDPHGTPDEQRQYRVTTSGQVNPGQDIVARADVLAGSSSRRLLPASMPPESDTTAVSHVAGDSRRFPGRGTVFRGGLRGGAARLVQDGANLTAGSAAAVKRRLQVQGDASDRETDGTADDAHAWRDWHAAPFTTFRYDAIDGWAMGFGGSGVVFADLARYAAKPEASSSTLAANQDNDDVANNIEITFGARPAGYAGLDPHLAAYYWNLKVPSLRRGADGALVDGPGRAESARFDGGRYELLLSTYMASETEIFLPPDGKAHRLIDNADGTQSLVITDLEFGLTEEEKAEHREVGLALARRISEERLRLEPENHLQHAAYGLFAFSSRFGGAEALSRLQTFHFGRQTFTDTAGNRVSDIAGTYGVTNKRFFGRTMGWLLTGADSGNKSADSRISGRHRIRGTVQLMLDIYASDPSGPGFILGAIDNLQIESGPGRWSTDASGVLGAGTAAALLGTVQLNVEDGDYFHPTLNPDAQNAPYENDWENLRNDGTYSGIAVPLNPTDPSTFAEQPSGIGDFFAAGEFEGALYGPRARIPETAGTWWVPARLDFAGAEGIIGSFGAFCGEADTCSPIGQ